ALGGRGAEPQDRLRPRHLFRRRPADLPQAYRRRRHRGAGRRHRPHDEPRARGLAPRPELFLPARRRPDVRHGALLPHRARDPRRPRPSRDGLGARHLPREDRHQRAEVRDKDRGKHPHPRDRRDGLRERLRRDHHHQLRRLDGVRPEHRDLRHRGLPHGARPEHVRRPRAPVEGRRQGV
ncbi:MAG: Dehydrogenase, partial [uncultured Rubrobacteraceae bacterium]